MKSRRFEKSSWYPNTNGVGYYIYESVSSWTVYHFHDTSSLSAMRRDQSVRDWDRFRHDASNIAAFLMHLKRIKPESYLLIRDTVRLIAPFFDDFLLRPQVRGSDEQVRLEWHQKGSDFPFQPNHLSDGTIRFVCLATALLQPVPPATIVIDEPELGLHPYAISILAALIKSASERTQVIISTQSPTLLDYFAPEEIVVVNRREGRSTFERLDPQTLCAWMEDYSVGDLWQKNVVQGGPTRE
jgi:predicted ATPase